MRTSRHTLSAALSVVVISAACIGTVAENGAKAPDPTGSPSSVGRDIPASPGTPTGPVGGGGQGGAGVPNVGMGGAPAVPDKPLPFEHQPAEAYVSRVKNLVNGGAVTAEELDAVKKDPKKLAPLIDGWMAADGFRLKMLEFFKVALQQTDINHSTIQDQNGEEFFANPTKLFANLSESIARTAWNIVDKNRPFSEVVNTRTIMMTTAIAGYLLYLDVDYSAIVADKHTFYHQAPADHPPPPWSLEYSIANRVWWTSEDFTKGPRVCPDPWKLTSFWLLNFQHGALHCNGYYHNVAPSYAPTDYTDWRPITVEAATAANQPPVHWDILAIRQFKDRMVLRQPRVGFFTSPAFFATWPTNDSNAHRLTANQTLIAALGFSIDPEDATVPMREVGLSKEHSTPGTGCYACHRILDPMRDYFDQHFSTKYRPQTNATKKTRGASFGFAGVQKDGGSILDFADTLASHPLFAPAWVQKLCYYGNTVGCDQDDPEFKRVLKAWQDSGLNFKVLVRELFASPLVTGSEQTLTWKKQEFRVSMIRRQHVCGLLSTRLGVASACDPMVKLDTYGHPKFGPATQAVGILPDDAFGRGSVRPILPTDPDMFYRGTMEALCEALADQFVDVKDNPKFVSTKTPQAIEDLIHTLLALPDNDSRAAIMRTMLTKHFADGRAAGADPTQALKSTFTLACTSPFLVSVGF